MPLLLILAHPTLHRSRANSAMLRALDGLHGLVVHDLYETYPDYLIDVEREQERLTQCKGLLFQHPFYWYSVPGLLKEWYDLVLTHGFAYGAAGNALRGKPWMSAITAGGRESAYGEQGYNRFTIAELMRPIEATANLCGCAWRDPFVLHGGHLMAPDTLVREADAYRGRVAHLIQTLKGA